MFSISKSISNYKQTYPDIDISCLFFKQKEFLKNIGGRDYFLGTQPVKYQEEAISYIRDIEKSKVDLNKFDIKKLPSQWGGIDYIKHHTLQKS